MTDTPKKRRRAVKAFESMTKEQQKQILLDAYARHKGNISHIAAEFNMHRGSLYWHFKKYGLRS